MSIDVFVQFSRLASEASSAAEILPLLADAAVDQVRADGAVVVELTPSGEARVSASRNVPAAIAGWQGEVDAIDSELSGQLVALSGGTFTHAYALPLVAGGGLFGVLVLFLAGEHEPHRMQVARGLVDLAAIAAGRSLQIAKLAQANADLRASREVLARTEKLRSLGQMAAGLSHDLKNILNPISMHAQVIKRAVARGDTVQANESLEIIRQVVARGVETIDRLRSFSRQSPEARAQAVDLNALTREAAAIARPRMSSRLAALSRIAEELGELPPVQGHASEIVGALVNLIVNAIDALPDGGTITLRTGVRDGCACVTVADTGPGMTPEVQAHVFEPFFTTKGLDGTGLGLANVFATMQRHGGSVSLESAPGQGAAFTLSFPLEGS